MEQLLEEILIQFCNNYIYSSLHNNVCIGNNCVLHTAASTSSGISSQLVISQDVVVQNGCTLYSCQINDKAFIGYNSVILEGAII